MNTTTRHTEYLATLHNCIVLEGLGAVLVSRRNAQINEDGSITPPHAVYTFNSAVTHSDGVLENSIARAEGCSYETACDIVSKDIEAMRRQLMAIGNVTLGRLGKLVNNTDNDSVQLQPFGEDTLTPLASWLPAVMPAPEADINRSHISENVTVRKHIRLRRFVRSVAAAAAIICVALVTSTPIEVDNAHYASMSLPEITGPQQAKAPAEPASVKPEVIDNTEAADNPEIAENTQPNNLTESADPVAPIASPTAISTPLRLDVSDIYCVVIASLTNEQDALDFISCENRRRGLEYGIMESDGRWRVYAATANTVSDANAAAEQLTSYNGAWVCRLN